MKLRAYNSLFLMGVLIVGAQGCGGSGGAVSISGLGDIPSATSMVATSSSSIKIRPTVSGTPPLLKDLGAGSNPVTYFFGTLLTEIGSGGVSAGERNRFFGAGAEGTEGAEPACRMAQAVGYSFENIIRAGTSVCYMKGMPAVTGGGVSITPTLANPNSIFEKQAADRLVKVNVTGDGSQEIYIKVFGSNNSSVGADRYHVDLWFCDGSTVTGFEQIRVDQSTGAFTSTLNESDVANGFTTEASLSATLTEEDGSVVFDTTQNRTASVENSFTGGGNSGAFKSNVTVTAAGRIVASDYHTFTGSGFTHTNKNYLIAGFTGSTIGTLRFTEAAVKGAGTFDNGTAHSHNFSGATEYRDSIYVNAGSTTLLTEVSTADLTAGFWASAPSPSIDVSAYTCSGLTPNFEASINMAHESVTPLKNSCDGDRLSNMDFCNNSDINTARNLVFQSF